MRFFRTTPQVYAQLQPQIDAAYYDEWIAIGRCEHILPPELPTQQDGKVYIATPSWFFDDGTANAFLQYVEEITQEEYQNNQPQVDMPL